MYKILQILRAVRHKVIIYKAVILRAQIHSKTMYKTMQAAYKVREYLHLWVTEADIAVTAV